MRQKKCLEMFRQDIEGFVEIRLSFIVITLGTHPQAHVDHFSWPNLYLHQNITQKRGIFGLINGCMRRWPTCTNITYW